MIRFFDIFFSFLGIVIFSPIFAIISILIKVDSKGKVFFRQERIGKLKKPFNIYKFRTMFDDSHLLGLLTVGEGDPRITRVGFYLRKYKLDELPQLINVFIGEMSIVGPRPEVLKYTNLYKEGQLEIFKHPPGITDIASIHFSDESELLKSQSNPEKFYIENILPQKISLSLLYLKNKNLYHYFTIILKTVWKIIFSIK
jgi:lipopolysaccharide/colanic/teichoic acid biosynthesis glycosyltransferase